MIVLRLRVWGKDGSGKSNLKNIKCKSCKTEGKLNFRELECSPSSVEFLAGVFHPLQNGRGWKGSLGITSLPPVLKQVPYSRLDGKAPRWVLNISGEEDSTSSLAACSNVLSLESED